MEAKKNHVGVQKGPRKSERVRKKTNTSIPRNKSIDPSFPREH